jgi:MYXO-CTERM domain-containing protein
VNYVSESAYSGPDSFSCVIADDQGSVSQATPVQLQVNAASPPTSSSGGGGGGAMQPIWFLVLLAAVLPLRRRPRARLRFRPE